MVALWLDSCGFGFGFYTEPPSLMSSSDFEECSGLVLATGRVAAAPAAAAGSKFAGVEDIQGLGVTLETPGGFG